MLSARLTVIVLAVLLAGCGAMAKKETDPAVTLENRAVERWQLLIDGKPDQAYDYLTPGYRATRSRESYAQAFRPATLRWRSIEWRRAECTEPDSCQARLLLTYTVTMQGAGEAFSVREVMENWLRVDGQWYYLPES